VFWFVFFFFFVFVCVLGWFFFFVVGFLVVFDRCVFFFFCLSTWSLLCSRAFVLSLLYIGNSAPCTLDFLSPRPAYPCRRI